MNELKVENGKAEVKLSLHAKHALDAKLDKLNRRAKRLRVPPVTVEQITPWEQVKVAINRDGDYFSGKFELRDYATFRISVDVPKLPNWTFLATLEHLDGVNLIKTAPNAPEGTDLSAYRTSGPCCEHCNKPRARKDTFVIEHSSGNRKQVGRDCLADVLGLGITPEAAIEYAQWISSLTSFFSGMGEDDDDYYEGGGGGYRSEDFPTLSFLNITAALVRVDGYRSKKYAEMNEGVCSTAADARFHIDPPRGLSDKDKSKLAEHYGNFPIIPTDEDKEIAAKAIAWAKDINPRSDFDWNLKTIAGQEMLSPRNFGIAAYVIAGYRRHIEKEVERKAKAASLPPSSHVGEIGKRIKKVKISYLSTPFAGDNDYGCFFIHRFRNEEGSDIVWKTSTSLEHLEPGTELLVSFTPKKHTEFKDRPQTEVSRLTILN